MASVLNVKESKGFCDEVFNELTDIKKKIFKLQKLAAGDGPVKDTDGGLFSRQLCELADQIDWKLQILAHSCTIDWKGAADFEETAQVDMAGKSKDIEFSPGYVGG